MHRHSIASFPKFESYPGSFRGARGAYAPSRNDDPLDVRGFMEIDRLVHFFR
jgi:hypothetical protein